MRYRLRTLLIALALAPPVLAYCWFNPMIAWLTIAVVIYNAIAFAVMFAVPGIYWLAGRFGPGQSNNHAQPAKAA